MSTVELESRLARLEALVTALQQMLNLESPSESLDRVSAIQAMCARHAGISTAQLLGRCREEAYCWPRMLAVYLCRKHLRISLKTLGYLFGKRNHGTMINACTRVHHRLETDRHFAINVSLIESNLIRALAD